MNNSWAGEDRYFQGARRTWGKNLRGDDLPAQEVRLIVLKSGKEPHGRIQINVKGLI